MKITVYCDREGILRYNPEGWPNEPNANSPAYHAIDNTLYKGALEKAKCKSIPFDDQDTVLFLISESMPGPLIDLMNLTKPDSFCYIDIEGIILIKITITAESVSRVAQIVKNELSGNSEQLPNIDMAARLCASKVLGIDPEFISPDDTIMYGFKAGFKAAQNESLEVLEYALERIKDFDRGPDPYIEQFIKRAKE